MTKEMWIHILLIAIACYIAYDTIAIVRKKEYKTWPFIVVAQTIVVALLFYQLYLLDTQQGLTDPSRFVSQYLYQSKIRIAFLIALAAGELLKMKRFKVQ